MYIILSLLMIGAKASISCIIKTISDNAEHHDLIFLAVSELKTSLILTNQYLETRDSDFWNNSSKPIKKSIKAKMSKIAFNAYTHFLTATDYLNQYADTKEGLLVPSWWLDVIVSLTITDNDFRRHSDINYVQLELNV